MTPGGAICIVVVGGIVVAYGRELYFEVSGWLEHRHALKLLDEMAEKEAQADRIAEVAEAVRALADDLQSELHLFELETRGWDEWGYSTLEQIHDLDEIVGVEDV